MSTPAPAKKGFRSRMGTVMRRSSTAFSLPLSSSSRPQTPSIPESDAASVSGSLSQLDTGVLALPPAVQNTPSPISESPNREAEALRAERIESIVPLPAPAPEVKSTQEVPAPIPVIAEPALPSQPAVQAPVIVEIPPTPVAPVNDPVSEQQPRPKQESGTASEASQDQTVEPSSETKTTGADADVPAQALSEDAVASYFDLEIPQTNSPPRMISREDMADVARMADVEQSVWADTQQAQNPASQSRTALDTSTSQPSSNIGGAADKIVTRKQSKSTFSVASGRPRGSSAASSLPQQSRAVSSKPSQASLAAGGQPAKTQGTPYTWSDGSASFKQSRTSLHHPDDPFADPVKPVTVLPVQAVPATSPTDTIIVPEPFDPRSPRDDSYMPAAAPVAVPLPAMHEVILSKSVHEMPSGFDPSNASRSTRLPTEPVPYETDERRPLLSRPITPPIITNFPQTTASSQIAQSYRSANGSPPHSRMQALGWQEYILPDGSFYFVHTGMRVTADIDLRNDKKLSAVAEYLDSQDIGYSQMPSGCEMWLRDKSTKRNRFTPVVSWVDHRARLVSAEFPPVKGMQRSTMSEDEKLDNDYRFWSFMEGHPAHITFPPNALAEAMDTLTWSHTDRLLSSSHSVPPPFSDDEYQRLMTFLRSFQNSSNGTPIQSVVQTRVVARILLRRAHWRQLYFRPHRPLPRDVAEHRLQRPRRRLRIGRTIFDVLIGFLTLGIPFLFMHRSRHEHVDLENGLYSSGPMLAVGACSCLVAAIVLSASVTLLSLPGLDAIAHIAGFVAIMCSTASMVSAFITLFRWRTDLARSTTSFGGEGFVLLSRRSIVMSLPLVFLAYSLAGLITGIVIYASHGLSLSSSGLPVHDYAEYVKWAVVGVAGGALGVLITSALLAGGWD